MKKEYQRPSMDVTFMKVENHLLGVSNVTTTDPTDGGDPTGGNGDKKNPFDNLGGAKAGQFDVEEEEDFKMW